MKQMIEVLQKTMKQLELDAAEQNFAQNELFTDLMQELEEKKKKWEMYQQVNLEMSEMAKTGQEKFASTVLRGLHDGEEEMEVMDMAMNFLEQILIQAKLDGDPREIAEANRVQKVIHRIRYNFGIE